ncbi:MAG: Ig-like domain-containing protein [Bacillota bacterium]
MRFIRPDLVRDACATRDERRPEPGFAGADTFTYTVSDGHGGETTATCTITVT